METTFSDLPPLFWVLSSEEKPRHDMLMLCAEPEELGLPQEAWFVVTLDGYWSSPTKPKQEAMTWIFHKKRIEFLRSDIAAIKAAGKMIKREKFPDPMTVEEVAEAEWQHYCRDRMMGEREPRRTRKKFLRVTGSDTHKSLAPKRRKRRKR